MAILDRFRTPSRDKHPDPAVRLAYVDELPLDDREHILAIARDDEDPRVRRAAVAKLLDPSALSTVAREDHDDGVREQAVAMLREIALEAFEGTTEAESLGAVAVLTDVKTLTTVARNAARETIARRALTRVIDVRALGSIARHAVLDSVRQAALERLQSHDEILAVALNTEFKDTALAAVERLTARADFEQVAARAKNKSAAKRARGLVRELDERAGAETTGAAEPQLDAEPQAQPSPGELWLRAIQRVEALASTDPAGIESALERAAASWASIDGVPDPELSARFTAAADLAAGRLAEWRLANDARQREAAETARREAETQEAARKLADEEAERMAARRRTRLTELASEAEAAAADPDLAAGRRRLQVAQREWNDVSVGADIDPELAARFTGAATELGARQTDAQEAAARQRRDALVRLQQLAARADALAGRADLTLKAADHAVRDLRAALADVPPLPSRRDFEEISHRLKAAQAALTPRLQELREADDWRRFANVGVQEQLCARMEALKALDDPEEIARQVRDLQQKWRQAADVPRAQADALWRRFKAAHDEVWARCEAHFAAQAAERTANLAKKVALCERAEALAESTAWIQTADEIKRLQAEWKTIGPVTRGQEKAVWERFRVPCDRFFTRRHQDLAERKASWASNLARKEALCVAAEALAESTEWDTAAAGIKRLQAEWKTIGPVKKSRSEAIWLRFRGACDKFFARYAQRHDIVRAERVAAREAVCAELEGLAGTTAPDSSADSPETSTPAAPPPDLAGAVRGLRARWQQELAARGVDRERAAALDARYQSAFQQVIARWPEAFAGTDLDPSANIKRMEALVKRIENLAAELAPGGAAADAMASPTTRLAAMLKEALAANTIGGKVDEESRYRAAQEEVRQAQTRWSRIGPVPDQTRREMASRFERACRRILDLGRGRVIRS